jgi:hypothetical protein
LSKGLNYAVTPAVVPVDILCGVKKALGALPEEIAEEVRQETARILIGSRIPKDILTSAERRALWALKANDALTVLHADKVSTPDEELERFCPSRTPGHNGQLRRIVAHTRVPITETMSLLGRHFEKDILRLFRHVLMASYFSFAG